MINLYNKFKRWIKFMYLEVKEHKERKYLRTLKKTYKNFSVSKVFKFLYNNQCFNTINEVTLGETLDDLYYLDDHFDILQSTPTYILHKLNIGNIRWLSTYVILIANDYTNSAHILYKIAELYSEKNIKHKFDIELIRSLINYGKDPIRILVYIYETIHLESALITKKGEVSIPSCRLHIIKKVKQLCDQKILDYEPLLSIDPTDFDRLTYIFRLLVNNKPIPKDYLDMKIETPVDHDMDIKNIMIKIRQIHKHSVRIARRAWCEKFSITVNEMGTNSSSSYRIRLNINGMTFNEHTLSIDDLMAEDWYIWDDRTGF